MPVTDCSIDGTRIRSLNDVYDQMAEQLEFPAHFERTLDVLWELLSTEIDGPFEITWRNASMSQQALGDIFEQLITLFQKLEEEREDFDLMIIW